jgi:hypothetical protein
VAIFRYVAQVPPNRKENIPAKNLSWTTHQHASSLEQPHPCASNRVLPRVTPPRLLSARARQAGTVTELWNLFFTGEMLDLVVKYTNENIEDYLAKANFSKQRIKKSTYLKTTDKVRPCV